MGCDLTSSARWGKDLHDVRLTARSVRQGVDIPGNFHSYNLDKVYGMTDWAGRQYAAMESRQARRACIQCRQVRVESPE